VMLSAMTVAKYLTSEKVSLVRKLFPEELVELCLKYLMALVDSPPIEPSVQPTKPNEPKESQKPKGTQCCLS